MSQHEDKRVLIPDGNEAASSNWLQVLAANNKRKKKDGDREDAPAHLQTTRYIPENKPTKRKRTEVKQGATNGDKELRIARGIPENSASAAGVEKNEVWSRGTTHAAPSADQEFELIRHPNGATETTQERKKREKVEPDPPYRPLQQPPELKQKVTRDDGTSADLALTISSDEEEEEEAVIGDGGTVTPHWSIMSSNNPGSKRMVPLMAVSFGRQVFLVGELTLIVKPWSSNELLEITGLDSKWGKPKIASRDVFALQLCKEKQFIMLQLQTRTAINQELRGSMLFADDDPKFGEEEERERDGSRFIVMYLENLDNYYTETEVKSEQCVHSVLETLVPASAIANYDWDPTRIQHVCMAKEIADNTLAAAESERREGLRKSKRVGSAGGAQDVSELKLIYPHQHEATDAITITTLDISRLAEGEYLNDSIVDLFFKAMSKGDAATKKLEEFDEERRSKVCFFSSHFFAKLREYETTEFDKAYAGVERWGKHKDIFKTKFAFFPIAEHLHWSLAVLCNMNMMKAPGELAANGDDSEEVPAIVFLDSLNMHSANRIATYLRKYVTKEWRRVNTAPGDREFGAQDLVLCRPNAPMQSNGCDCGVFVLEYAEELCMQWKNVTRKSIRKHLKDHIRRDSFGAAEISKKRLHIGVLLQEFERKYKDEKGKGKKVALAMEAEEAISIAEESAKAVNEELAEVTPIMSVAMPDSLGSMEDAAIVSVEGEKLVPAIDAAEELRMADDHAAPVGRVAGEEHIADAYATEPMEQDNFMDISGEEDDVANTTKEHTSQSDSDSQEKEEVATPPAVDYVQERSSNGSIEAKQAVGSVGGEKFVSAMEPVADVFVADPANGANDMDTSEVDDLADTTKQQTSQSPVSASQKVDAPAEDIVEPPVANDMQVDSGDSRVADAGDESQKPSGHSDAQEQVALLDVGRPAQRMNEENMQAESNSDSVVQVEAPSDSMLLPSAPIQQQQILYQLQLPGQEIQGQIHQQELQVFAAQPPSAPIQQQQILTQPPLASASAQQQQVLGPHRQARTAGGMRRRIPGGASAGARSQHPSAPIPQPQQLSHGSIGPPLQLPSWAQQIPALVLPQEPLYRYKPDGTRYEVQRIVPGATIGASLHPEPPPMMPMPVVAAAAQPVARVARARRPSGSGVRAKGGKKKPAKANVDEVPPLLPLSAAEKNKMKTRLGQAKKLSKESKFAMHICFLNLAMEKEWILDCLDGHYMIIEDVTVDSGGNAEARFHKVNIAGKPLTNFHPLWNSIRVWQLLKACKLAKKL